MLLYTDDFVLSGESLNEVTDKYKRWKNAVGTKGLRVKQKVFSHYLG